MANPCYYQCSGKPRIYRLTPAANMALLRSPRRHRSQIRKLREKDTFFLCPKIFFFLSNWQYSAYKQNPVQSRCFRGKPLYSSWKFSNVLPHQTVTTVDKYESIYEKLSGKTTPKRGKLTKHVHLTASSPPYPLPS